MIFSGEEDSLDSLEMNLGKTENASVKPKLCQGDESQNNPVSSGDACNIPPALNPIEDDGDTTDIPDFCSITCNSNLTVDYNLDDMKSIMSNSLLDDDVNVNMSILNDTTETDTLAPPPQFTNSSHILQAHPMSLLSKTEMYQLISDNQRLQEYAKNLKVERDAKAAEALKWRNEVRDHIRASNKEIAELENEIRNEEAKQTIAEESVKKLERYKERNIKMHYEIKCIETERNTLALQKDNAVRNNEILRVEYEEQLKKVNDKFKDLKKSLEKKRDDLKQEVLNATLQQDSTSNEINRLKSENKRFLDIQRLGFEKAARLLNAGDWNGLMEILCKHGNVPTFQIENGTTLFKKKLFYSFDDILFKVNKLSLEHMENAQIIDRMLTLMAKDYVGLQKSKPLAITNCKTSNSCLLPRNFNPNALIIIGNAILQSRQRSFIEIELD